MGGANIQLWECDSNNIHMYWSYLGNGLYANSNGKCMVVDNNHAYNGVNVQLWSCSGSEYYKGWTCYGCHPGFPCQFRGSSSKNGSDWNLTSLPVSTSDDMALS